jgi:serine/threonine protein kinase
MNTRTPSGPEAEAGGDGGDLQSEKLKAKARLGQVLNGKWRLDRVLGVGGMATVFAATHRNGSRAALKILHADLAREPQVRDRFLREGYVANKSDHRGRVQVSDDAVTELDEPYLVMELLEGQNLQQLWKRRGRKLGVGEALILMEQALDTLASYHANGVIHRDFKPANVFVTKDNVVKVLDFGVARMRDAEGDKTRAGTALGTPSFMAPEQAMGVTEGLDARADVFSVGATLYALLSGQRLHQGRSDNEAFILAATTPAPSLARSAPELPVEVIALVDRALQWDPRNRWDSALAMRDEILRILTLYGISPTGEPAAPQQPNFAQQLQSQEQAAEAEVEVEVGPDDPVVLRLQEMFKRMDRLLAAARQYGWQHPEADRTLRALHSSTLDALKAAPNGLRWTLTPYSFIHRSQTIWEPPAPYDIAPYNLFASGTRAVSIHQGITAEDLRGLCEVMLLDNSEEGVEDDVAAALWEKKSDHVKFEMLDLLEDDEETEAESFYEESARLEEQARLHADDEMANEREAAAMAIATDDHALEAARAASAILALDPVARKALGVQLSLTFERWAERYVDAMSIAAVDALRMTDLFLLIGPVATLVRELLADNRHEHAVALVEPLIASFTQYGMEVEARELRLLFARAIAAPDVFRQIVKLAGQADPVAPEPLPGALPEPAPPPPVGVEASRRLLDALLPELGPELVGAALDLRSEAAYDPVRAALFAFVERSAVGAERAIAERIPAFDADLQQHFLKLLAGLRTPGAHEALGLLTTDPNPQLRCEAIALHASSPEQIRDQLAELVQSPQRELRFAALRTLAAHQVRPAGPLLVMRMQDATFQQLAIEERRELFEALWHLHPSRAELLAIELVQKHGLLADEALDQTRTLCAELLGRIATSAEALEAVLGAAKRRPWNTPSLRTVATEAATAISVRAGKGAPAVGGTT